MAYAVTGGNQAASKGSTVTTGAGTGTTSDISFVAVEDLGGGMSANVTYGIDPRTFMNDGLSTTNNTQGTAGAGNAVSAAATGLTRSEAFVGISGGFGNLRLGSPNSIGLNAWGVSSPLGTGIGSGFSGNGVSGSMTNSIVQVRYSRSVRWDSPTVNGFQVSALYAPGNDEAAVAAATTTSGGLTAQRIPNARQATEIGIRYAAGPLTVAYANIAQGAQTNATGYFGSATAINAQKTSANILSASYKVGSTTLHLGMNSGDRLAAFSATNGAPVDSKGSSVGVTHTMGAIGLMASYRSQEAKSGTAGAAVKADVMGLRADYSLSKRTTAYVGYEKFDNGVGTTANESTLASVGVRHSF
jgi:predicted porin